MKSSKDRLFLLISLQRAYVYFFSLDCLSSSPPGCQGLQNRAGWGAQELFLSAKLWRKGGSKHFLAKMLNPCALFPFHLEMVVKDSELQVWGQSRVLGDSRASIPACSSTIWGDDGEQCVVEHSFREWNYSLGSFNLSICKQKVAWCHQ